MRYYLMAVKVKFNYHLMWVTLEEPPHQLDIRQMQYNENMDFSRIFAKIDRSTCMVYSLN